MTEYADVETSSDAYAKRFAGPVGQWLLDRQTACTRGLLCDVPAGARVLDVGGGHAQLMPLLAGAGYDVTVIGSAESCSARLVPWLNTGAARFEVGDLLELPYPDREFHLVLSFRLLPHTANWRRLLGELCRVSAQHVIVDYPSRRSVNVFAERLFSAKKRIEGDTRSFTVFDPGVIRAAFESAGFAVASERGQFFFPMALHRGLRSVTVAGALEMGPRLTGLVAAFGSPRIVRAVRASTRAERPVTPSVDDKSGCGD